MEGAQTDWGLPGSQWEGWATDAASSSFFCLSFQKQLDLLVPKQSECLKDNDEIFLNAYLDTIVNTAQIKLPAMLEIKEPILARIVHCVGVGLKSVWSCAVTVSIYTQHLPLCSASRGGWIHLRTWLRSYDTRINSCRVIVCYSTKQNLSERHACEIALISRLTSDSLALQSPRPKRERDSVCSLGCALI